MVFFELLIEAYTNKTFDYLFIGLVYLFVTVNYLIVAFLKKLNFLCLENNLFHLVSLIITSWQHYQNCILKSVQLVTARMPEVYKSCLMF